MRKLSLILFIFIFLFYGAFILSFYIPRTVTIEFSKEPPPLNNPNDAPEKPTYLRTLIDIRNNFISEGKSFLEINLSALKVRLYQEGKLIKKASILTIGDPQGWGGSAAGLYKIRSGSKLGFSVVSNVYMPYSFHYYGKYYLHGQPYYPSGRKLISSVSGGCIRLNNKDAKEIYELTELDLPVLVIDKEKDDYQPTNENSSEFPTTSAKSYLVADLKSGFVFAEKKSKQQFSIASLTKLMTALVVSENVDLRKSIIVKEKILEPYGSTQGLEKGKRFRIAELFYPLLIESSNDAAEVLSYFLGRHKTIEMMNEKADAILMKNTEFVDPHGFNLKNVSTARDLFQLARNILNNRPPLFKITKGEEVPSFGEVRFNVKDMWNKNVFINDPSFVGGKTGYLRKTKENAIFIFKFLTDDNETRNIVIILLGSDNKKTDTQKIYKWLRENYHLSPAAEN